MKKTTKVIALMLAVLTVISAFSVSGFAVATPIEAGNNMATAVTVPEFGVQYVGSLSSSNKEDWYKFTTFSDDAYYRMDLLNYNLPTGNAYYKNINVNVYDVNNKEISSLIAWNGSGFLSVKLENNTIYYIRVTHEQANEKGNYEITVSVDYDVVPNEMENAVTTQLDKLVSSEMDGTGDIDWFKFTAPVSGNYTLTLNNCDITTTSNSSERCMNVYLYDKWLQTLSSDYTNNDSDAELSATLEEGETYYVKVYMGGSAATTIGKYTFIVDSPLEEAVELESVTINSLPSKTTYYVGESFEKNGLIIKANYSDGTSETVTNYTLSGFNSSSEGSNIITVSYTENGVTKNASFTVDIVAQQADDPDSAPEDGNGESDEDNGDDSGFFAIIAEAFMSILDFFMLIIGLFTSLLS